jgi:hypothetical protein
MEKDIELVLKGSTTDKHCLLLPDMKTRRDHRNKYMEEKFHREKKTISTKKTDRNSVRMGKFFTVEFLFHIFISMDEI